MRMHPSTILLLLASCTAFKYESKNQWELSAPNTLCASGIPGGLLGPCPQTKDEINNYDAIVMDEHGFVDVTISGLYFTSSSRRLEGVEGETAEVEEAETEEGQPDARNGKLSEETEDLMEVDEIKQLEKEDTKSSDGDSSSSSNEDENDTASPNGAEKKEGGASHGLSDKGTDSASSKARISENARSKLELVSPTKFHIQVYLVSLDIEPSPTQQHGVASDHASDLISHYSFISGNGMCCYEYGQKDSKPDGLPDLAQQCTPMDMRPMVPRLGVNQKISAPVSIAIASKKQEISVSARFRPVGRGRYMVVISNCAATFDDDGKAAPLTAHFNSVAFKFASKFGELPLSMSGIVPFYGVLFALYGVLGFIWLRRSRGVISCPNGRVLKCMKGTNAGSRDQARPLLGLQKAIYSLILLQFAFTSVAFAYYVHLNITVVDIDILYGGTMAALAGITPFSILVGTVHFITFVACQAVVMLATDGTWLIQSSIRPDTKKALYALGLAWACFFATNTLLSRNMRLTVITFLGLTWVAFLVFNIRRSLRHLRSLILGQSNETVVAIGGNLVAKRSMYRKFFAVLAVYPIVFAAGVIWNVESQEDSWAWVGYVLVDVYVFIILLHASITWLPRPLAAMEYAKYTPLDQPKSSSSINDPTVWEEEVNYSFDDLELS